nr:uncharacterized protein LOC101137921 [Gorilla gorilla gorilla]
MPEAVRSGEGGGSAETSAPPYRPGLETLCSLLGSPLSNFYFWDWKKKTRNTSSPPTLCLHARDSAQVTQTAESTWRNRSVPIAPATPSPLRPSLGPTMRPCAAPAVRPGIWSRDGGNIRQIFKTEPREQSRPLCGKAARELGAAGPQALCWARRMRMRAATCELGFCAGFYPS